MKNVLYIGNNLSTAKTNVSSIQTLGMALENDGYCLKYASHLRYKVLRLIHMIIKTIGLSRWADKVIIDTYSTQNFYFAVAVSQVCRILRLPYICSLNGGNLPMRLKQNPKLCHLIFNHSKCCVSPSQYLKEAFASFGYTNVVYIPNSILIDKYPVISKDYNDVRLLWVRSFSKIYNPAMAITLVSQLVKNGYKASLCMIGPDSDGTLKDMRQLSEDKGIEVLFTGKLTKAQWVEVSKDYNIFINTTNFDNMPVSVMEAMALGFPIVSTDVGGMPYLIKNGKDGILVPKNDIKAMYKSVVELFKNKALRDKLSKNARQKAESFDWIQVREKWFQLLDN